MMRRALMIAGAGLLSAGLWTTTADAQWRRGIGWDDFVPDVRVGPGGIRVQDRDYYENRGDWRYGEPRFYRNDRTFYPPPSGQLDGNRYYYEPSQRMEQFAPATRDSAQVRITLPDPDAAVWISGRKSQMSGQQRVFQSPPLEPGKQYEYKVRVAWYDGEEFRTEERTVSVEANRTATVAFGDAQRQTGDRQEMEAEYQDKSRSDEQRMHDQRMRNETQNRAPVTEGNRANQQDQGLQENRPNLDANQDAERDLPNPRGDESAEGASDVDIDADLDTPSSDLNLDANTETDADLDSSNP